MSRFSLATTEAPDITTRLAIDARDVATQIQHAASGLRDVPEILQLLGERNIDGSAERLMKGLQKSINSLDEALDSVTDPSDLGSLGTPALIALAEIVVAQHHGVVDRYQRIIDELGQRAAEFDNPYTFGGHELQRQFAHHAHNLVNGTQVD